ncbi:MAG: pilus assembly protein N-terminal domain-containing protein [Proteobacteria bacterium]|nr:pilus assembly protein N-terminal domain-containing protein [Pseudomonadota bacterium]
MNNFLKHKAICILLISAFILTGYGSAFGMGWFYKYVAPLQLNVSPTAYEVGQAGSINASGGQSPITIYTNNPQIVAVRQTGSNMGTVMALNPGTASIIARDGRGTQYGVTVTVKTKPLNTYIDPPKITIGQQSKLSIDGGMKPYRIAGISNGSIISLQQIAENAFYIMGRMPGQANITVQDRNGQSKVAQITVSVPPLVAVVTPDNFKVGERATATLSGGMKPYYISAFNRTIVALQQTGPASFFIIGINPGTTDVVFKDAQGQQAAVKVTVQPKYPPLQASINPYMIPISGSVYATLTVKDGMPGYAVYEQGSITRMNRVSLNEFRIYGLRAGTTNLMVRDASGKTISLQLTITAPQAPPLNVQWMPPKDVFSINERFNCAISGGTPNYSVYFSVPNIVTVGQAGPNTFQFQAVRRGITEIKIVDRNGMGQTKRVEVR